MDATSIDLIVAALLGAASSGVASGVQSVASDAVKDTYQSFAKGLAKLLGRTRPVDNTGKPDVETAEQIIERFQVEPDRWESELREWLAEAEAPGKKMRKRAIELASLERIGMSARDSIGVQQNVYSRRPKQQNIIVRDERSRRSDSDD